jgi:iron complex outermembrane receptor protein
MTIELGHDGMFMGNHITGSVFYNDVEDFVTTYRVGGTTSTPRSYKNVDATLYGYELTVHRVMSGIDTTLNLNYTRGEDDTQNIALPQIMPLAGDLTFELKSAKSNYGLRINFADTQDRFDSNVLDTGETSGYTVYDIFAGFEPTPNLRFTVGMSNITDKRYATHLNNSNVLDGASVTKVDEPGRSLFGSINYEF